MWQQEHFIHYNVQWYKTTGGSRPYSHIPVSWGSLQKGRCQIDLRQHSVTDSESGVMFDTSHFHA